MGFSEYYGRHIDQAEWNRSLKIPRMIALIFLTILIIQVVAITRADTYNFHGVIVDEEGNPLSNVEIQVYDMLKVSSQNNQNGYYVTTASTQSDGSYKISLYSGTFKLVYIKDGYVKQTKILGFTTVQDVDLGAITLIRSVSITLTTTERTVPPGTILNVRLTIVNVGDQDESVQLQTFNKANWTTTILDSIGEVDAVTVNPGASAQLNLRVIVPVNATGNTVVNITAVGSATTEAALKINVSGGISHFVTCQFPSRETSPGAEVNFEVVVSNPYPYPADAVFTLTGVSADWAPVILNGAMAQIQSTSIPAGGSSEITVSVDVPQTIKENTTASLELQTSLGGLVDYTPLSLVVQHQMLTLGFKTGYVTQSVELGNQASFPITLENPGETDELLTLSMANLPAKWTGNFITETGGSVESILIGARSSVNLSVVFKPDVDATPSIYHIQIKGVSTNLNGTLNLEVDLVGNTAMKLDVANLYSQINVGETQDIQITLENTGYTVISYPTLLIDPSVNTLLVQYSPIDVIQIAPGQSQVFTLSVTPQEGTAQGDYIVEVRGSSPEILTDPVDIRITVAASSSQTLIIAGVLVVAFASIFLVYRKFRRK